ncbi:MULTISPECIES: heavy metal translocating P-type ATPase [Methylobacterium]|uniref:Copper-translocating P-type ATPase n=1 Tax=Methylobacterium aquaticum TaxID=270351 RepID=A0A0C6FUR7_9HYPH|nr:MULTISPECIES: heavy metal translocating P-type ATPase [Methylobacterium]NGM38801.1 heavy metal translocating P-type ATPase [Methylobacterium sp. DB0501]BAQ49264.1 copper-translocating P-type ATPase [Methylobacterium aquaticum]
MCCTDMALAYVEAHASWSEANTRPSLGRDYTAFVSAQPDGSSRAEFAVEGVRCAACMSAIERGLAPLPGVASARLNFSDRRLAVTWAPKAEPDIPAVLAALDALGYAAQPFAPGGLADVEAAETKRLIRALAVAAFASMNVMLLAVSVWAGNVSDMTPENRDLFHWIQALIALPAAAYAGRPFYEGAFRGLRAGRVTMDFPITLGVVLTLVMSVVESVSGATHAYFDGAVMLLFFLLIGRVLDQTMLRRTRAFAENIAALRSARATLVEPDGSLRDVPLAELVPGSRILIRPGERVAADGVVEHGASDVDQSLVTGETAAVTVRGGDRVFAGALNGSGALTVTVTAAAGASLLDEVEGLMRRALEARSRALVLADRATRLYVPLVHAAAALTLVGWLVAGAGWHAALLDAVAVLIVTCPCALGLAIPAVQVVAAGALFREGVLLNDGTALERFAQVDTVVFDKTGTLTLPEPVLMAGTFDPEASETAARLALSSRHPMATALAATAGGSEPFPGAEEAAGLGVRAQVDGVELRLGSARFCGAEAEAAAALAADPEASVICFRAGDGAPVAFPVCQGLRPDAAEVVAGLATLGYRVLILSGDRAAAVASVARRLGVAEWEAGLAPQDKIARIEELQRAGRRVLMLGDGLNDAPALATAHASLSPVTAAHVSQAAADALFLGRGLAPVLSVLAAGRRARRLMLQNLWFSAAYNVLAVPLAAVGLLTPLIAALAMSGSSLVVTANALRARLGTTASAAPASTRPAVAAPVARTA